MRPGEASTRRTIRRRYTKDFAYSEELLTAAHKLHGLLCDKDVPPAQKCSKVVAVGLWMKLCKQYRSILVLCELGLVKDAEVVARSLFESAVQTLFVLKRNIRLRRGWRNAPKPPRRGFSAEFRAKLYLARNALNLRKQVNVWQSKRGLRRATRPAVKPVAGMVKTAQSWLGPAWINWLESDKCKAAFTVEMMAVNVGLGRWYDGVYRPQSAVAHANDALDNLDLGKRPMTIDAHLRPDIERATVPLRLANVMCVHAAHAVNARFGLGFDATLDELAAGAQTVEAKMAAPFSC
ncbi:MAG: hypothetical protein A2V98_21665 [Planctomycetes bacterium RBG_16_64_12]|nr:MAG: hypothetical protein A2V98_21665 [Planctomycetes bacterium RBG_16_64_12]